jgi:hypothetical protein
METITRLRQTNEQKYRQKEEETRTSFVNKVREKEAELKEREREVWQSINFIPIPRRRFPIFHVIGNGELSKIKSKIKLFF